jgi:5-methyltetrahydropteroyltriglutamate--homocysteine methyltransferase
LANIRQGTHGFKRVEPEVKIWEDVQLPEGKKLIPGLIAHTTNVVEHPELVAQHPARFATLVGRDNVIGGTHCYCRIVE